MKIIEINFFLKYKKLKYNIMDETNRIIKECKKIIENKNLQEIKEYYNKLDEYQTFISNTIAYEYIFQKIFIHACNYGKEIIEWLIENIMKWIIYVR